MSQNVRCKPERQAKLSNAAVELSLSVREIEVEETLAAVVPKELLEHWKQLRPNVGDDDGDILESCLGLCGLDGRGNDEGPSLRKLWAGPARWSDDARGVKRQKLGRPEVSVESKQDEDGKTQSPDSAKKMAKAATPKQTGSTAPPRARRVQPRSDRDAAGKHDLRLPSSSVRWKSHPYRQFRPSTGDSPSKNKVVKYWTMAWSTKESETKSWHDRRDPSSKKNTARR